MPAAHQSIVHSHTGSFTPRIEAHCRVTRARAWYACYTHSRREKKVECLLRRRGIESFLPVVARERQWHDRRKVVPFPLFPSYVFARFHPEESLPILMTPGVANLVRFDGRLAAIGDDEIENIARFARALGESGVEPPPAVQFQKGERVGIMSGPFEGVEGVVVEVRGRRRVLVGLRSIGLAFEVDVAVDTLKARS